MQNLPLRSYQAKALEWLKDKPEAYLAVDMGLGKTRIVLEHIKQTGGPVLVIAPMRVALHTWPSEIAKWAPELTYTVLHGKSKEDNFKLKRDVYIVNYDGMKWFASMLDKYGRKNIMGGLLVLDESTMVKSPKAARTKLIAKMRSTFKRAIALSATPSPNGLIDLWSQYLILDYGHSLGSKYYQFFNRYFRQLDCFRVVKANPDVDKEIVQRVAPITFRLDAEDHLKLPDFVDNDILVDLPTKAREQYDELAKEFALELAEQTTITAVNAATLSMKLRQLCQGCLYTDDKQSYEVIHSAKLDALEQILEELNGRPALIPIQFKFELHELFARFGKMPAITGGLKASESTRIISAWNRGDVRALICHPASLSHGVNLQAGGHNLVWLGLTWNYEHYTQLNGRLRRQGQTETVVRTRILCRGTIEQKIATALNTKGSGQQLILDALKYL